MANLTVNCRVKVLSPCFSHISTCLQKRTIKKSQEEKPKPKKDSDIVRERIIRRAALEFEDGMYGIL